MRRIRASEQRSTLCKMMMSASTESNSFLLAMTCKRQSHPSERQYYHRHDRLVARPYGNVAARHKAHLESTNIVVPIVVHATVMAVPCENSHNADTKP